ncbi:IS3 family transposase [Spiroplasma endosymbiont of Aspidapion aeneum]|uniref:IS3 family transposase n=1 Tax=Spiroplasma endosymbiont of Aspidapion aeneum TaxID=3066276 RepID=UPI00313ABB90
MANLGQKFKTYDPIFRRKIVKWFFNGKSILQISEEYNINRSTIKSWIASFKKGKLNNSRGNYKNTEFDSIQSLQIYKNFSLVKKDSKIEKYKFIIQNSKNYKLKNLLNALDITKSAYFKFLKRGWKRQIQDEKDIKIIKEVFDESRKQYGYRRIATKIIAKIGIIWNHKKVLRLMHKFGIIANYVIKMIKKAKRKKINYNQFPDLVNRKYSEIKEPLTTVYTDVTYLILNRKRAYMSTVIDAATKEIIDFRISRKNNMQLIISNINAAANKIRQIKNDQSKIVVHSDHCVIYSSQKYQNLCKKYNLIISQGRYMSCADNVVIESFHALLKKGTVHNNDYKSLDQYIIDIIKWCRWYNAEKNSKFHLKNVLNAI